MAFEKVVCAFVFLTAALCATEAKNLPPYIIPCRIGDPDINECIKEHANEVIPKFNKEDSTYKIASLTPLKVKEAVIDTGKNLVIKIKDFDVYGLENLRVVTADFNYDAEKKTYDMKIIASTPQMKAIGNYDINGKVLILPIVGHGPSNFTFDNLVFKHEMIAQEVDKKGVNVFKVGDMKLDMNITKSYINLENLFNGDKQLGDNMNKFLEENAAEIFQELKPAFSGLVLGIIENFVKQVVHNVPADKVFLH